MRNRVSGDRCAVLDNTGICTAEDAPVVPPLPTAAYQPLLLGYIPLHTVSADQLLKTELPTEISLSNICATASMLAIIQNFSIAEVCESLSCCLSNGHIQVPEQGNRGTATGAALNIYKRHSYNGTKECQCAGKVKMKSCTTLFEPCSFQRNPRTSLHAMCFCDCTGNIIDLYSVLQRNLSMPCTHVTVLEKLLNG